MNDHLAEGIAMYLKATTASAASITGKSYRGPVWVEIASLVGDHNALKHRKCLHMISKQNRDNVEIMVSSLVNNQSSERKGASLVIDTDNVTANLDPPSNRDEQAKKTVIESNHSNTNFSTSQRRRKQC